MPTQQEILENGIINLPDGLIDRHLHIRRATDGRLPIALPASIKQARGAIIMPNTETPHILTIADAEAYRVEILSHMHPADNFEPWLTLYITDNTKPEDVRRGFEEQFFVAAKLYPANATTGSAAGVTSLTKITPVLYAMAEIGMPLLLHGEVVDEKTDPLDMEKRYIDEVLVPFLLRNFPTLKIVMEHITTKEAAELIGSGEHQNLWATITPHHLLLTHKDLFQTGSVAAGTFRRGSFPDRFCLPIAKRLKHRDALWKLVASGSLHIGAGTDSAPHFQGKKYSCCGAAGCFVAPIAVQMYAHAFEKAGALQHLADFLGVNMLKEVYQIEPSYKKPLTLRRGTCVPDILGIDTPGMTVLDIGEPLNWVLA